MNYARVRQTAALAPSRHFQSTSRSSSAKKSNVVNVDFGRNSSPAAMRHPVLEFYNQGGTNLNVDEIFDEWVKGTSHLSQISRIKSHPAFDKLAALGWTSIAYAIDKLESDAFDWHIFLLLKNILKVDPVPSEDRGKPFLMAEAWLEHLEQDAAL